MAPWLARIRQRIEVRRRPAPAVDWRQTVKRRTSVAAICLLGWGMAIEARLVYLQVIDREDYTIAANAQQTGKRTLTPRRGDIYDRNRHLLATSADGDVVWADPEDLEDAAKAVNQLCGVITCTESERRDLAARFSRKNSNYAKVKRRLSAEQAKAIAALNIRGVHLEKESRRHYPQGTLAAGVLGWAGDGENGLGGIEYAYNGYIGGTEGQVRYFKNASRETFNRTEQPAIPGADLQLTLDDYIQHVAERELANAVREHQADGGAAIVVAPRSGEILAMASVPTFDPNIYTPADAEKSRNLGVQYSYEPGSTFKIVTAAAAIEEHVMPIETVIDTSPGMIRIGKDIVDEYEHHNYGALSFTDVIVKSSNVGAIKIGQRVGTERLGQYVSRFGFGAPVSVDFPAEARGNFRPPQTERALASMSMGYQIQVTPLQVVAAFSSIANGGEYVEPRIVKAVYRNGKATQVSPKVVRRSIASDTAAVLTSIMEQVVERGTAKQAQIAGYTIAGKTGTASKVINRHYSDRDNYVSFAGFVPSRNPAIAIVVMIDNPRAGGRAGGVVAAPVFKRIAETTLRYLGVPRSINPPTPVLVVKQEPNAPSIVPTSTTLRPPAPTDRSVTPDGTIPDLRMMNLRDAVRTLTKLGVHPDISGNGFVRTQEPPAGTPIEAGMTCRLVLDRAPEPRTSAGAP